MAAAIGVADKEKDKDRDSATSQTMKKSPEPEEVISEGSSGPSSVGSRELPVPIKKKTSSISRSSANETSKPEFPPHPAVVIPTSMTETTVTAGQAKDTSPKEQSKVSSWLKSKFSRRASKTIKPEDAPIKVGKAPENASSAIEEESTSTRTTDPTTALSADHSNATTTIAAQSDAAETKEKTVVTEPITGLPMDTSKSNPGFGTDDIPHIATESNDPPPAANAISPVSPVEADAARAKENFAVPQIVAESQAYPLPTRVLTATDSISSERDVALAGRELAPTTNRAPLRRERSHSTSISSLSSDEPTSVLVDNKMARGRPDSSEKDEALRKGSSATQGSSVGEEFEEARDAFDAEQLPLPSFRPAEGRRDSPVRETRFHEEL